MHGDSLTPMQKVSWACESLLDFQKQLEDTLMGSDGPPAEDDMLSLAEGWKDNEVPFDVAWACISTDVVDPAKVLVGPDGRPLRDVSSSENLVRELTRLGDLREKVGFKWLSVANAYLLHEADEQVSPDEALNKKLREQEKEIADLTEDNEGLVTQVESLEKRIAELEEAQRQTCSPVTVA